MTGTPPPQSKRTLAGFIHLLKTFINADKLKEPMMLWQVVIHVTFAASAIALACIDRLTLRPGDHGAGRPARREHNQP